MKKEWNTPKLQELHIHETMSGMTGNVKDGVVKEPDGEEVFDTHGLQS